MRLLILMARLGLLYVFLQAALPKIIDPGAFAEAILNYRIVGWALATIVAATLPWVELFAALGLLTRTYRRGATWLLGGLLFAFTILHGITWARGIEITCGCFGSASDNEPTHYGWAMLLNLGMIFLLFLQRKIPTATTAETSA